MHMCSDLPLENTQGFFIAEDFCIDGILGAVKALTW